MYDAYFIIRYQLDYDDRCAVSSVTAYVTRQAHTICVCLCFHSEQNYVGHRLNVACSIDYFKLITL